MRSVWGQANNEIVCVMFLEVNQESAMLIKNCSISVSWCRVCWRVVYSMFRTAAEECVHYCPLYAFSATFRTRVTRIQVFTSPMRLLYPAHVFPFEWTLFSFWLKRWTQSMVLPAWTDPLSNHESVPAHSMQDYVIKYRGYTLQQWGEHGTPPKNPLPSNFNPCDVSFLCS